MREDVIEQLDALRRERSAAVVTLRLAKTNRQRRHWLARIAGLDREIGLIAQSLQGPTTGGDDGDDAR